MNRDQQTIRAAITNEVIRAVAALRQQRTVAREQDGQTVFVSGTEAAREYLIETLDRVLGDSTWRFDRQVCDVCQGVTGPERDTSACRCDCVNCVTGHCDGCYYGTHAKEGDSTPPATPVEPPDKWQFAQELMRDRRDIPPGDECDRCGGWGVTTYGNTATWRGGIGGSTITDDVCDRCWGSGNKHKPWPSRR